MVKLEAEQAAAYLQESDLIRFSDAGIRERFSALSGLFYKLVKQVTSGERMAFRNFYARFRYLLSQLPLTDTTRENLESFRRFIKDGTKQDKDVLAIDQGVILLEKVICLAAGQPLKKATSYKDKFFIRLMPRRNYTALHDLKVLCTEWTAIENEAFTVQGYDLQHLDQLVTITIRKYEHVNFLYIHKLLAANSILHFSRLTIVNGVSCQYSTSFDSLITLEPDFLVDATAIGECFTYKGSNSDLFFLSRLTDSLKGSAALKGSIIGYYLDEMVRNDNFDHDQLYLHAQRSNALVAAQLGHSEMQGIKQSIHSEHLPNIAMLVKKEKGKKLWIEPTYFSKEFGLQGRIDLLGINTTLNTKDIVELKSGSPSPPENIAWVNHKMQVVSYDMLLESTYGEQRQGSNTVFYSRCQTSPSRYIVSEHIEKNRLLYVRNKIVASIYQLAAGDFTLLQNIKAHGIHEVPTFSQAQLERFRQLYDPKLIASQYYQELLAFTLRELINAKVGHSLKDGDISSQHGFSSLWLESLDIKEEDFQVVYDLQVQHIDEAEGKITLSFTRDISHAFRKGDPVILYPKNGEVYNALQQHILKGLVHELHQDKLILSLYNKQTDYNFIKDHTLWAIEPDFFEKNFWSVITCLFNVIACTERKKKILFGHEAPVFSNCCVYTNDQLTGNQQHAVQQALNARDYYLLQGPPGTGKTSTFLVNYVKEAMAATDDKIVVLAFTNKAVEKICEAFRQPRNGEPIPYIRLGNKQLTDDSRLSAQLTNDNPDEWKTVINKHRVFVSTVATFQNNWLLLKTFIRYNQVVIDEASQLTEAAIAGVLALFDKFILIGDQLQLPAVIAQEDATCLTNNTYLNKLGISDYRISLFERLMNNAMAKGWHHAYSQLTSHYRMHQDIANVISTHYREALTPVLAAQTGALPAGQGVFAAFHQSRLVFVDTPAEIVLKTNRQEARLIAAIVRFLMKEKGATTADIGIITPFRAQIAEIKKQLSLPDDQLVVDTVERYQGDEKKYILFSTTISHTRQLGAIQSVAAHHPQRTDRKLLVSLSRASEQFILLGNAEVLQTAPMYQHLLATTTKQGGFLSREFALQIINSATLQV